jgi:hypothetical protein
MRVTRWTISVAIGGISGAQLVFAQSLDDLRKQFDAGQCSR